jgi:hypothetical protein
LDSTKLHSDVLFLDRTWNTNFHHPLQSFLKKFISSSIISTNSTDDAARWYFWSGVNKWGTIRAHNLFFLKSSTSILHTVSLLIPVISFNIRTLKFRSSVKYFWMTSSWNLYITQINVHSNQSRSSPIDGFSSITVIVSVRELNCHTVYISTARWL